MTEKFRFIPEIPTAPGVNRALLTGAEVPIVFQSTPNRHSWHEAHRHVPHGRRIAEDLGKVSLSEESLLTRDNEAREPFEGWRLLRDDVEGWLDHHLDQVDLPNYNPARFDTVEESNEAVKDAAHGGIATVIAFQEVISRVLFRREVAEPNADLVQWAERSQGFIVEWMGLHESVDPRLAYALASPKPQGGLAYVFDNLRFHSRWFVAHDARRRIGLDPSRVHNLRDATHERTPQSYQPERIALFGCPARKMIPLIYRAVTQQAQERGLFAATYYEERAQHGYDVPSRATSSRAAPA